MRYSLNCAYYSKEFYSLTELIDDVRISGMDPSYDITLDGKNTNEIAADYLVG